MEYTNNAGILKINLVGRIDSNNAIKVEEEINSIRESNSDSGLILDLEKLDYISSAGLRIILRLRKKEPQLKIINVNTDVYEIFDMTGFTQMMTIEKAYRVISIDGAELIGTGANGMIYRIDKETIVKVYRNPDSLQDIQNERELSKKAFVLDIPTAISYDIAKVGDSYCSDFELLDAKSIAQLLALDPAKIDEYVSVSVNLLKKIHSTIDKDNDMPKMKNKTLKWVEFCRDYLPKDIEDKLYKLVENVPDDNHLLHGDYHIKNVMIQQGEALLIDMDTLCVGNPIFEFASMFNAYEGFPSQNMSESLTFLGISYELGVEFWKKSLIKYFGTEDEDKLKEIEDKAKIIGYLRLFRRGIRRGWLDDPQKKTLLEFYKNQIIDLVQNVDSIAL